MKTFLVPAYAVLSVTPYFYLSRFPRGRAGRLADRPQRPWGRQVVGSTMQAPALVMQPGEMDAAGMFVWAGILAVVGVAASYGIALWWQRWRASQKNG